jgi:hypothetical protein
MAKHTSTAPKTPKASKPAESNAAPKPAATSAPVAGGATTANSPTSIYLDTLNKNPDCDNDKKAINAKCTPEPEQSEEDKKKGIKKPKKKGIAGKLSEAAELFDTAGKLATGYKRDKGSASAFDGNGWMDDHCTGMWFSPTDTADPNIEKHLNDMIGKIKDNKLGMLKSGFEELAGIAIEKAGSVAQEMVTSFATKTIFKTVVGVVFGETVIVPILMGAWTVTDLLLTAEKLAVLAGDKGKAALDALKSINNIGDKAKDILENYKKEPHRAQADAMSLMAQLDPCLRARKCLLVPFKNADADGTTDHEESAKRTAETGEKKYVKTNKAKSQAKHGGGCCPGQTGHHILPNAMLEGAKCPGYDYDNAPTMCLEGSKNGPKHGSHGMAHGNLKDSINKYTEKHKTNILSYDEAKKQGIDAVQKAGAIQCERKCLEAQLDAHYKCTGKNLNANAGGGGAKKNDSGKETQNEDKG